MKGTPSPAAGAARGSIAGPAAASVVVLACTALLRFGATAEPLDPGEFGGAGRQWTALLVAQPADCEDASRWADALVDASDARIGLAAVVIGRGRELERGAERLRQRFGPLPVRPASRRNLAALRALGIRSTPFVVVMDAEGRVRLTADAPRDSASAARFRHAMRGLLGTNARRQGGET